MDIEKEESKSAGEQPAPQDNSTEEQKTPESTEEKTSQKNESQAGQEEEKITLTKQEHEKLLKKATDFDGIIEKQRLQKLSKKEEEKAPEATVVVNDEIKKLVAEEVARGLTAKNAENYNSNLTEAYKSFIKENSWADSDEIISTISSHFQAEETMTKEELAAKLEAAAQNAYPMEYKKAIEQKVRKQLLLEEEKLNAGGSEGITTVGKGEKKGLTKEQIAFAQRCGNDPKEVYADQVN